MADRPSSASAAPGHAARRQAEILTRGDLEQGQLHRLNALLPQIAASNPLYASRLSGWTLPLRSLDELRQLPFTFKEQLLPLAPGERPRNCTFEPSRYVRYHQTSGTRGRPMAVYDTAEDWQWWLHGWQFVLDAAGVAPGDRLFLAFSFGPFIGFWTAFEAALARGCLAIPGGGMSSLARLEVIRSTAATAIFCTPSYALHLAEVAREHQLDPRHLGVRTLVLAGEPGASAATTRARLEEAWNAVVIDHAGATEVGPWGYGRRDGRGLHVLESEFIAEFLSVETGQPAADGELSELVLTNLGRVGNPVLRYRTGDLVRPRWHSDPTNGFVLLEGGVQGRVDDMVVIRGVNIFPTAIEQIIHGFPEILEYRAVVSRKGALDQLQIEIEDRLQQPQRVADELHLRLGLQVEVTLAPSGSLPRFDGKGRRFLDARGKNP